MKQVCYSSILTYLFGMLGKFVIFIILFSNCMYIGGFNLYTGKQVRGKIISKASSGTSIVTLVALTASGSGTKCSSDAGGGTAEEVEPNGTCKTATKVPFPTTGVTYIKGTFSSFKDRDWYYMIPSSDLKGTQTMYYKDSSNNDSTCSIGISTPQELTNDSDGMIYGINTTGGDNDFSTAQFSVEFDPSSHYIFIRCKQSGDSTSYELELTMKKSSATSSQFSNSSIASTVAGFVMLNSKLDMNKYYTRESVDKCLNKLSTTIPIVSVINANLLVQAVVCGTNYFPLNEYGVAALTCDLEEAGVIQIGDLGVP